MNNDLDEKIDAAVAKMCDQVKASQDGQKALHFSQAALNLAHAKSIFRNIPGQSSVSTQASESSSPASSKKS